MTKSKVITQLLETIKEKDRVIEKLVDRLMARDYQNYKEFETVGHIDGQPINQHDVERVMENLIGEIK